MPAVAIMMATAFIFGLCTKQVEAEPSEGAEIALWDVSCAGEFGAAQRVARVTDAVTFELENGTVVRLAGVIAADGGDGVALSGLVVGKSVRIATVADNPDRYGRTIAHVLLVGEGQGLAAEPINNAASSAVRRTAKRTAGSSESPAIRPGKSADWVQGQLVSGGHAMAFATRDRQTCVEKLVAIEDGARAAMRGLWRDAANAPRSARDVNGLVADEGRFRHVAGKVARASIHKGRVYLNFGRNWRTDFTVLVPRELLRATEPEMFVALKGKRVLVRGWLVQNNGPLVVLEHTSFVQVLE